MALTINNRPFVNVSGEVIPQFAVVELHGWQNDSDGIAVFRGRKPTMDGKLYLINYGSRVPAQATSYDNLNASGVHADGHYALYDPELDPQPGDELGPVAGEWWLGDGTGFVVVGDQQGSGPSNPGFPFSASTRRVRVVVSPAPPPDNIITGTVATNWSQGSPTFIIRGIQVLEGPDPRNDPGNPLEGIIIENVPPEARQAGQFIKAKKNKSTGKWYPDPTAQVDNIIFGTVLTAGVTDQTPTFEVNNILVIDGPDPRQNPDSQSESITIQNVPRETRVLGTRLRCRKSQSTGLWYPDSTPVAVNIADGKLKTDLTVDMQTVVIIVTRVPVGSAITVGQELVCKNPVDLLQPTFYEFTGNKDGNVTAIEYEPKETQSPGDDQEPGWTLLTVQPPIFRPVKP